MARSGFNGSCHGQDLGIRDAYGDQIGHLGLAFGQGAGLVERHGGHLAQPLEHGATLQQQATTCACRQSGCDGGGRGDHQGARAADQQDGQTFVDPFAPGLAQQQRRHDGNESADQQNGGRVVAGKLVDEAFGRRLAFLGFFHQSDHPGDRVVAGLGGDPYLEDVVGVDGAGEHAIPWPLVLGNTFSRHRRLVHGAAAFDDVAIGGDTVTRADHHHRLEGKACSRDFPNLVTLDQLSRLRDQVGKPLDARPGPSGSNAFQQFPHQEQQHDGRCLLRGADDDGPDCGDAHQCLDREW
ncbi:hypothetical protein FF80_00957 [Devosia sp. LC5]|nr:hypothetical protein FF80_00957 [Devosia sp. LC5]